MSALARPVALVTSIAIEGPSASFPRTIRPDRYRTVKLDLLVETDDLPEFRMVSGLESADEISLYDGAYVFPVEAVALRATADAARALVRGDGDIPFTVRLERLATALRAVDRAVRDR